MGKKTQITLMIVLISFFSSTCLANYASQQYVSEGRTLLFNNGNPTYSGIEQANIKFEKAVTADPTDQVANFFYGVTRVAVSVLQPGGGSEVETLCDLLEDFGFSRSNNDYLEELPYKEPPKINDKYVLANTIPSGNDLSTFWLEHFIPLIDDALDNVSRISSTFTVEVTATETGDTPIEIDYGDVLIYKCFLLALKGAAYFIVAYNLDVDLRDVLLKINMNVFQIQRDLINEYAELLHLQPSNEYLNYSKQAFLKAISAYLTAYDFITNETDFQGDDLLFFDNDEERLEAQKLGETLSSIQYSLENNTTTIVNGTKVDFNNVFGNNGKNPLDIRDILPVFDEDNDIIAGTFPGTPILNGIFPEISDENNLAMIADLALVYQISEASIILDGNAWDWLNVPSIILDAEDSTCAPWLGDIHSLKVAVNPDNPGFLYWTIETYDKPVGEKIYFNVDFSLGHFFDTYFFPKYRNLCYKDSNSTIHYSLEETYYGQVTNISNDSSNAKMVDVVEARLPLSLFNGVGKVLVRAQTQSVSGQCRDFSNKAFIQFPTTSVSGIVNCPNHDGVGQIFIWVCDSEDLNSAVVLGTGVLNYPSSYIITNIPIGREIYLFALWDADNNGIFTEGDYVNGQIALGPFVTTKEGIVVNINVNRLLFERLLGDWDNDDDVDGSDLARFAKAFAGDFDSACDLHKDGYIDEFDLEIFAENFGR